MPTSPARPIGALTLEIASCIRGELARQQLAKTTLADRVGISRAQLNKIVNGKKANDIENLDRIVYALRLDLETVLREADEATPRRHLPPAP